jgi:hypothetical protein
MNDLIFGYEWEEIKAAQQCKPVGRKIPKTITDGIKLCKKADLVLLEKHGIEGLKKMQFYGVLDRLQQAGIYNP